MVVESVSKGTPAQIAKLAPGDIIHSANGQPVGDVDDLRRINNARGARATAYVIERDGERRTITITPRREGDAIVLGIRPRVGVRYVSKPVGEAAIFALEFPALITGAQIAGIADMIRRADASNLMGPVGMTEQFSKASERGLADYVLLMIILSVALGMFNLLPFPALDGGRLMFLAYELIARRRPNERFEAVVHTVGLLFLLVVVALVSVREIGKLLG
jgi:regulator of sigma E protease